MFQNADIGPVRPKGHPRMFVRPVVGGDPGLVRVLEGKLARLIQWVPTIWIEHIPAAMQDFVVGVPPVWIHIFRRVARAVLVYRDAVERLPRPRRLRKPGCIEIMGTKVVPVARAARLSSREFWWMMIHIFVLLYMTGSTDQTRSIYRQIFWCWLSAYLQVFFTCLLYILWNVCKMPIQNIISICIR